MTTTPLFRDLQGDDPDPEVTEVDSLCMNCQENVSPVKQHGSLTPFWPPF